MTVEEADPGQQGLKLKEDWEIVEVWEVEEADPGQQGLKPGEASVGNNPTMSKRLIQDNKD